MIVSGDADIVQKDSDRDIIFGSRFNVCSRPMNHQDRQCSDMRSNSVVCEPEQCSIRGVRSCVQLQSGLLILRILSMSLHHAAWRRRISSVGRQCTLEVTRAAVDLCRKSAMSQHRLIPDTCKAPLIQEQVNHWSCCRDKSFRRAMDHL